MLRFPPRRILAAVDPSEVSLRAWRAARQAAERFGASLDAVYCDNLPPPEMAAYLPPSGADARRRRETVDYLRRRMGPHARLRAVVGDPIRVLTRLARERRYDLIVLGSHRREGFARWLLGSTAEAVVRDAPCPVLIVPAVSSTGNAFRLHLGPFRSRNDAQPVADRIRAELNFSPVFVTR